MKPKEMDYDKNAHISLLYKIYTLLLNEEFVIFMNCIGKDMQRKRAFPPRCVRLAPIQCLSIKMF